MKLDYDAIATAMGPGKCHISTPFLSPLLLSPCSYAILFPSPPLPLRPHLTKRPGVTPSAITHRIQKLRAKGTAPGPTEDDAANAGTEAKAPKAKPGPKPKANTGETVKGRRGKNAKAAAATAADDAGQVVKDEDDENGGEEKPANGNGKAKGNAKTKAKAKAGAKKGKGEGKGKGAKRARNGAANVVNGEEGDEEEGLCGGMINLPEHGDGMAGVDDELADGEKGPAAKRVKLSPGGDVTEDECVDVLAKWLGGRVQGATVDEV